MVGRYIKNSELHFVVVITPSFRGKIKLKIHQTKTGNIWFIFKSQDLALLGLKKNHEYFVFFNDGEVIAKIKLRKYKPYWAFWLNAQYLPQTIYSIIFEEVKE